MEKQRLRNKLPVTETFEVALNELFNARKDCKMTKIQVKILSEAINNQKSETFQELKNLTLRNQSKPYSSYFVLNAIRKNQKELTEILNGNQKINKDRHINARTVSLENALKDLELPQTSFERALGLLCDVKDYLNLSRKQEKIILAAKKKYRKTYRKLKSLTGKTEGGTYLPIDVLEAVCKNRTELIQLVDGKQLTNNKSSSVSENKKNKKGLPLDTNYKYPTKTSNSIWTVRIK